MIALWIVAAVGGWMAVSLPVAVLVGRTIRMAENRATHRATHQDGASTRVSG